MKDNLLKDSISARNRHEFDQNMKQFERKLYENLKLR